MITSIGYDAQGTILEIEFRSGRTYRYFDVPEFLYRGFVLAASKGQYFTGRIDSRFRFEEVQ
jgi:lysyl-tRNA synthetase class 2